MHAVIDGLAVPELPAKLAAAGLAGFDCLRRGALAPADADRAPHLAELSPTSPFTDWLLTVAAQAHPDWGVLVVSERPLLPVREWSRDLMTVSDPDGHHRDFRWYDPQVLQTLLPALAPSQLDEVFALGQALVVVRPQGWSTYSLLEGVLSTDERSLLATAER